MPKRLEAQDLCGEFARYNKKNEKKELLGNAAYNSGVMQSRLKPSIFSVTSQARFNFGVESVVVFCKYLVYRVLGWIGCHIPSVFILLSTMLLNFSNLLFIYNWCNIIHNLRYFLFILLSYWFFCFYTVSIPFFGVI